jgi:hypothetical protein
MRSKGERTIRLWLAGAGFAWLLGVSQGGAAPVPQVLKGSTPGSAKASGMQASVSPQQLRESPAKKMGPGQIKSAPKKSNPHAASSPLHASMTAALRAQKQAAEAERSTILASQRMAPKGPGTGARPLTPGRTMGNSIPAGPAAGAMRMPGNTITPPALAGLGMAQGPCLRPTIGTVNGQAKGTVFTPDPQFNLYTIKGCMFGDTQGQAYIYGPFAAGQVSLQIEFWSDTQIIAKVNPQVTGELDQSNVTLVVVPSGAPQVQKAGFKFYAVRETMLLAKILPSVFVPAAVTDTANHPVLAQYSSPGSGYFPGRSASVVRDATSVFNGGQDFFDFSKMKPGFIAESMVFEYWDMPPEQRVNFQENGVSNAEWVGDNIRVSWKMQHFHTSPFLTAPARDDSQSGYALNVWVSGPRGVSPWPN